MKEILLCIILGILSFNTFFIIQHAYIGNRKAIEYELRLLEEKQINIALRSVINAYEYEIRVYESFFKSFLKSEKTEKEKWLKNGEYKTEWFEAFEYIPGNETHPRNY